MDSGIRLTVMFVVGLILLAIGFTGRLGSVFGAIIDPGSMTGSAPGSGDQGLPTSGTLTPYEIGSYWYSALAPSLTDPGSGAMFQSMTIAIAVALAESGGKTDATNQNSNGSIDRGLWQINSVHSQYNASQLFQPAYNAMAAVQISNLGTNWQPWTTYNTGAYQQFLNQAQSAASQVLKDKSHA